MSTYADNNSASDGRGHQTAMWLGHYEPQITIAAYLTAVASNIATYILNPGQAGQWAVTAPVTALMLTSVAATICDHHVHKRGLCLRDLRGVPFADPDAEVTRRMRHLTYAHSRRNIAVLAVALVVVVGGPGGMAQADKHHLPALLSAAILALLVCGFVTFAYHAWMRMVHQRLRPWCPLCRWGRGGEGGDGPEVPDPTDPVVETKRTPKWVTV